MKKLSRWGSFTLLATALFLVGGFFAANTARAATANITQIKFTSSSQTVNINTASAQLTTQTQNVGNTEEQLDTSGTIIELRSSSPTGQFSDSNSTTCTGDWSVGPRALTMSSTTANKNFCYKDSTAGTHTLTVIAQGPIWTPATQTITITDSAVANVTTLAELNTALADATKATINITANISGITATVAVERPVTINGGGFTLAFVGLGAGDVDDGLTLTAPATINNLIIDAGLVTPTAWVGTYAVQVYNTTATLNNVTATNGNGGILVNGSNVTLTGVTTLSGNGFGGMEVSKGTPPNASALTVTGTLINTTEAYGLPTLWLINGQGSVAGTNVPATTSTTVKAGQTQYYLTAEKSVDPASMANVSDLTQLKAALADSAKTTINITAPILTTERLLLNHPATINGGGNAITFSGVTTWISGASNYVLQVYNTTVTINDIKLTGGYAALLVNGSNVTLTGAIDVSGNGAGGIELGLGTGLTSQPTLTVTGATFTNTTEAYGLPTIWEDRVSADRVTGGSFTKITKGSQPQYYLAAGNSVNPIDAIFDGVASSLSSQGIASNIGSVTAGNFTAFSGLSFEKFGLGKITFNSALDLSSSTTQTFLTGLGSILKMSNGRIALDISTATAFADKGATLVMYGLPLGLTPSKLVVRSDTGAILDPALIVGGFSQVGSTVSFTAAHFTQFDIDTTPPVITRIGSASVEVAYGSTYTDEGATATDNISGNRTSSIIAVNPVNTGVIGTYTVTYNVSDTAGNTATEVTRTVNVVKANQTITFGLLSGKTYGDADFTLSASSTGLPVSFRSSTPLICTVSGTTAHIVTVGQCTIQAYQEGDNNYNPAYPDPTDGINRSFSIIKADVSAPSAPMLLEKSSSSITLVANPLNQFTKDNGLNWQDSNVFGGLTALTDYIFNARVKETTTTNASLKSVASSTIKTDANPSSSGGSRARPAVRAVAAVPGAIPAIPATPAIPANRGEVLGAENFTFSLLLKMGSSNKTEVMELQKFLNGAGHGTLVVDGKFGKLTKAALIKFQLASGLKGDGIVGALTRAFLNK